MIKGYLTTSDKARIYYEDCGEGDAIVLVPGHMCTTKFFQYNVEYLSKTHRVITLDNRGFGNSSKPLHGNDVERHADDLKELFDFLGLENIILIGWSLSGSIVTTYAHKYQCKNLKALGLLDCCLFPFSPDEWNSYNSKNYNMDDWNTKYSLWHTNVEQYVENFVLRLRENITKEEETMICQEIVKTPPWIGFALHTDWCHTDATAYLPTLTVPIIIFSGESKGHGYSMGRYYKQQIKTYCELHEFENGGHLLFFTESETFNELLMMFINRI